MYHLSLLTLRAIDAFIANVKHSLVALHFNRRIIGPWPSPEGKTSVPCPWRRTPLPNIIWPC